MSKATGYATNHSFTSLKPIPFERDEPKAIQARAFRHPGEEEPSPVINDLAKLLNPTGRLGIVGVFPDEDPPSPKGEAEKKGKYTVPWGLLFKKGIEIGMGRDQDMRYNRFLRDLITAGKVRPGSIVSHRLPLAEAADAHGKFDRRAGGYVKVVLDPAA